MNISNEIDKLIVAYSAENIVDAKYIVLDDESYFTLKEELFGSVDAAISEEIEEIAGLKIFHNNIGYTFIDVA